MKKIKGAAGYAVEWLQTDQRGQAEEHWRIFAAEAPDSPWADEARRRLTS